MAVFIATCHTPDNNDPDRRIQGLGGAGWWKDIDTIINEIRARVNVYYSQPPIGPRALIVAKQRSLMGRWYLTTEPDNVFWNNLLNLPTC